MGKFGFFIQFALAFGMAYSAGGTARAETDAGCDLAAVDDLARFHHRLKLEKDPLAREMRIRQFNALVTKLTRGDVEARAELLKGIKLRLAALEAASVGDTPGEPPPGLSGTAAPRAAPNPLADRILSLYQHAARKEATLRELGFEAAKENRRHRIQTLADSRAHFPSTRKRLVAAGYKPELWDPNDPGNRGDRPLHEAARYGRLAAIEALLDAGAELEMKNDDGFTPFREAISYQNLDSAQFLLERGANVNSLDERLETPLHRVVIDGKRRTVEFLLKNGADANATNKYQETPTHLAAQHGNGSALLALTAAGARLNEEDYLGQTPLHFAASRNQITAISILVASGADPTIRDSIGRLPEEASKQAGTQEQLRKARVAFEAKFSTR